MALSLLICSSFRGFVVNDFTAHTAGNNFTLQLLILIVLKLLDLGIKNH